MRYRLLAFWAAAAALATGLGLSAQDILRVDVRLVNVITSVTDSNGRYVANLKAEDFIIEEDGVPQKIAHFSQDSDIPVSVGVLFDASTSMQSKLRTATQAVDRFIQDIHKDDDIFLMTFSGGTDLLQDFTNDRKKLARALQSIRLAPQTKLYDGVASALAKVRKGRHDKRAILLITDGQDTSSRTRLANVLQLIRESEILVYSLGTAPMTYGEPTEHVPFTLPSLNRLMPQTGRQGPAPQGRGQQPGRGRGAIDSVNMDVLNEFAESSGARAFRLAESFLGGQTAQMDRVLAQIADELRSQYTLGYYPTVAEDGRFHTIKVTARTGHAVRTRRGYQTASQ